MEVKKKKLTLLIAIIALLTGCQTKNNMDDKVVCTSTRTMTIGNFKEYYELENTTREIVDYINDKKRENLKFQNEYNYLYSKGKILERRK